MNRWARGLASVTALGLCAGLTTVVSAPPASALGSYPVPSPVTVPGSVYGPADLWHLSDETWDVLQRTSTVQGQAPRVAAGVRAGQLARAGGGAFVAVTGGIQLGLELGTGAARLMGLDTTDAPWCDLTLIARCALGPDPVYVPNWGVSPVPPGWYQGVNSWTSSHGTSPSAGWKNATVTNDLVVQPVFNSSIANIQLSATISGQCLNDGNPPPHIGIRTYWRNASTGVVSVGPSYSPFSTFGFGYPCSNIQATSTLGSVNAPGPQLVFDHLVVRGDNWSPSVELRWYPQGHALWTPGQDGNPVREWVTTWRCSDGTTGVQVGNPWREADETWPPPPAATCAPPSQPVEVEIAQRTQGLDDSVVYEWTAPAGYQDWVTQRPECVGGGCVLDLKRNDQVTGQQISCFSSPELCTQWHSSPSKVEDYQCVYGGQVVALDECNAYSPTFNPAQVSQGVQYANPVTGTTTGTVPNPGENPDNGCPPAFSWTSLFNPWYYYKGVACALEWAFVPSSTAVTQTVQQMQATVVSRPPFTLIAPIGGLFTGIAQGWSQGCSVLPDFDPAQMGRLQLPCEPPSSAPLIVLKALANLAVIVATGFGVWHMLVAALGGDEA